MSQEVQLSDLPLELQFSIYDHLSDWELWQKANAINQDSRAAVLPLLRKRLKDAAEEARITGLEKIVNRLVLAELTDWFSAEPIRFTAREVRALTSS